MQRKHPTDVLGACVYEAYEDFRIAFALTPVFLVENIVHRFTSTQDPIYTVQCIIISSNIANVLKTVHIRLDTNHSPLY